MTDTSNDAVTAELLNLLRGTGQDPLDNLPVLTASDRRQAADTIEALQSERDRLRTLLYRAITSPSDHPPDYGVVLDHDNGTALDDGDPQREPSEPAGDVEAASAAPLDELRDEDVDALRVLARMTVPVNTYTLAEHADGNPMRPNYWSVKQSVARLHAHGLVDGDGSTRIPEWWINDTGRAVLAVQAEAGRG